MENVERKLVKAIEAQRFMGTQRGLTEGKLDAETAGVVSTFAMQFSVSIAALMNDMTNGGHVNSFYSSVPTIYLGGIESEEDKQEIEKINVHAQLKILSAIEEGVEDIRNIFEEVSGKYDIPFPKEFQKPPLIIKLKGYLLAQLN